METVQILQLGTENWIDRLYFPKYLEHTFSAGDFHASKQIYDLVFVDRMIEAKELEHLYKATRAYCLYVLDDIPMTEQIQMLMLRKKGKLIARDRVPYFLSSEAKNYFPNPYGEKFLLRNMAIAQGFSGSVEWRGDSGVFLEGEYGEDFHQIAYWRNNIPVFQGQAIDLWLEYEKDPGVEIELSIVQFKSGSLSDIQQSWRFSEAQLQDITYIDNQMQMGMVFVSLFAKGKGKLKIVALHDRYSRRGHGLFLPGGQRKVTSKREEIFYYFDPGDLKPPLNVYFSGYKTMQGFEGYYMMRKMGCPFLLIAEPRLEGGAFYLGDEEYENTLKDIILEHVKELGFTNEDVILSGLSMGTFGALYYGCDIQPHAMILGKPLASLGDVAANERLHRPGGFGTSLDVLYFTQNGTSEEDIQNLNKRFWDKFDKTEWNHSKFVVSYMIEDDYDKTAYDTMISHLHSAGVQVYGKGIHGRHNDATGAIAGWFKSQYEKILEEDFSRGN